MVSRIYWLGAGFDSVRGVIIVTQYIGISCGKGYDLHWAPQINQLAHFPESFLPLLPHSLFPFVIEFLSFIIHTLPAGSYVIVGLPSLLLGLAALSFPSCSHLKNPHKV